MSNTYEQMELTISARYSGALQSHSETAAGADACTYHILPVVTQVTSL